MNAQGTYSQCCSCSDTNIENASVPQVTASMPKKCPNLMQKRISPSKRKKNSLFFLRNSIPLRKHTIYNINPTSSHYID